MYLGQPVFHGHVWCTPWATMLISYSRHRVGRQCFYPQKTSLRERHALSLPIDTNTCIQSCERSRHRSLSARLLSGRKNHKISRSADRRRSTYVHTPFFLPWPLEPINKSTMICLTQADPKPGLRSFRVDPSSQYRCRDDEAECMSAPRH